MRKMNQKLWTTRPTTDIVLTKVAEPEFANSINIFIWLLGGKTVDVVVDTTASSFCSSSQQM